MTRAPTRQEFVFLSSGSLGVAGESGPGRGLYATRSFQNQDPPLPGTATPTTWPLSSWMELAPYPEEGEGPDEGQAIHRFLSAHLLAAWSSQSRSGRHVQRGRGRTDWTLQGN